MKCYKFISLLAVFFAVTTLTHAQNAGPCTGSEYATDAEFFRAYASAQSSDATASKKKAMTGARTALETKSKQKQKLLPNRRLRYPVLTLLNSTA